METRKTPLVLTASALAMALVLVGCGGGGSSGSPSGNTAALPAPTTPTTPTPPPAEPTPTSVELPTSMYLMGDDAPMALADTTAPISLATGGMHSAGAYDFTCTAGPCEITITDGEVMATGTVTAAFNMKYAEMIETNKETMTDEMNRRTAGLHEALTRSDGADDIFTGGPGGNPLMVTPVRIPEAGAPATTDIVITRGLTGDLMVMRDRAGWHGDAKDAKALGGDGWNGKVLMHAGGAQKITVYSNIQNAVRADFEADDNSIYRPARQVGEIPHLPTATTDGNAGPPRTPGPVGLQLDEDAMEDAAEQGLLDLRYFPKAGATGTRTLTYTYEVNPDPGPRNFDATLRGATFHGASGTYTCTSSPCTIDVTPASATAPASYDVTGGNTWQFTPDREATVGNDAQLHRQDNDWLSFGYWISEPENARPGGAFLYNAQVFYGGANEFEGTAALTRRLNATYNGRAAGLYARQADADDDIAAARGEFTADASLTARFGQAAALADVSGTIDNFMNGDGVDMSEWALTLGRTNVTNATGAVAGGRVMSGSSAAIAGRWEAQLYGPNRTGEYPSGIAGRFFSSIDANTAVAGGFGAER